MRRLFALLVVATLAVAATGCGSSIATGPDLASFTPAAKASAAADSGRFELQAKLALPGTDKSFELAADGGFDTPARRAQITVDLSSIAQLLAGLSELGATASGDLPTDPASWQLEAIRDGDAVYVHFPLLAAKLPAGKTWVKGSAKEIAAQGGSGFDQFGSFAGTDPRDTFAMLEAVSGSIETVGGETVRGTDTTHYRATIDTDKVKSMLPADQQQSLGSLDAMLGQAGVGSIPLDVWLDAEQRVRKLETSIDIGGSGSQQAHAELSLELYDYGEPLDVSLPPADKVAEASTLKQPS